MFLWHSGSITCQLQGNSKWRNERCVSLSWYRLYDSSLYCHYHVIIRYKRHYRSVPLAIPLSLQQSLDCCWRHLLAAPKPIPLLLRPYSRVICALVRRENIGQFLYFTQRFTTNVEYWTFLCNCFNMIKHYFDTNICNRF